MIRISLTIKDIFNIPTSEIFNPDSFKPVNSVLIDSRNITKNSLFVALKGDRFDGHDFLRDAVKNGISAAVINKKKYKNFEDMDIPIITVNDTTKALGDIAAMWRSKLKTKIIAITGSNGKTSTKEMIALLLNEKFSVNKTVANNNNHIGVPITIFSTNNSHDMLVLELGTNHYGEIEYTSNISQPDYALITNIGESHLEFLINRNGVLKEKEALFRITSERNGWLFINNDDKFLNNSFKNFKNRFTYGFTENSKLDVEGKISGYNDEGRPIIEIQYKNKKVKADKLNLTLPIYGTHNATNFLAAAAVGLKLGLTKKQLISGAKKLEAVDKRLNVKKSRDFVLIDDTYNANPESMKSALELLPRIKSYKRKIAVLGDMFELGKGENTFHKKLLPFVYINKIDELYLIGKRMKNLYDAVDSKNINKKYFKARESLKSFLNKIDLSNAVVLVKGSRGMRMEEFVKVLEQKL
jgi:UDP-N-acetylmuramoyl-tripeptide--D-alanyl-D-alanine ligase